MTNIYRFADVNIEIHALHPEVFTMCEPYRVEGVPDFAVSTTQRDIEYERAGSARADEFAALPPRHCSDGFLETLAVYRGIAEKLPEYDGFLIHGSCVAVDGGAYLFTAKSGTGKSTHTRLWRELLGERARMVNDDKPLIRMTQNEAVAYGTPWDGKHHLSQNTAVPLRAVCVLERAGENYIHQITPSQALPMLLQQIYRPMNEDSMRRTLQLIDRLTECVKLYRLGCNMDISAAELSYNTMKG